MPEWPRKDRLRHEKEVLGFYVSGHPLEEHADLLRSLAVTPLGDLMESTQKQARVAGMVTSYRKLRTKKGDWMAFIQLEDLTGTAEVVTFPEPWKIAQSFVDEDALISILGQVETDGDRPKILVEEIAPLSAAQRTAASGLRIEIPEGVNGAELEALLDRADEALGSAPGACPVRFEVRVRDLGLVTVEASVRFFVDPVPALIARLEELVGAGRVSLTYA
jgi:DNA polymerase-3 subunit alpha